MTSSGEISKTQKTKLSLQRKVIKPCTDHVDIIKHASLNETCEFRSVEKMQKFFSSSESQSKEDEMKKGKSTRRNLINKNSAKAPKNEKSKKKVQIKTEMLKDTESTNAVLLNQPSCSTINKVTEDTTKIENTTDKTKNQNDTEADQHNVIEIDCEDDDKPGSKGRCLACGKDDLDSQDMATHLRTCLKSRFQRGKTQAESEEVVGQGVKSAYPKVEKVECFFCQICQKDLSKMNSQRRTQHLNRCIDKDEEEQNIKDLEKKALENAKTAVLDCPMCGKPCKTENARKVHVKKCGQQLKVTTDQMLKLMKKQEEEHQMLIAAGILPKSSLSKLKGKERSSSVSTKTKKTPKEPKSQFDADLQMAMAISISESKSVDKPEAKKGKKKKGPGDPPLLVAMTNEEKKRRLSMRVTNMLVPQEEEENDTGLTPEFARSGIEDKYVSQTSQIPSLWNRCSLQSENKENWKKETYYVDCLVPPIEVTNVKAGSKIKRMSEIPGRDTSFIRPKTPIKTPVARISRNNTISESGDTQEEILVASTQTAVILAELAADSSQLSVPDFDCSGFCPEQPINIQPLQNTDLLGGLQKSMLSLVNKSSHADVQIHTIGGDIVFCHKVILSCRCHSILQYEEGGHIYMEDMASDAMISIMKYIYGGLVSVTQSCLSDVVKLADRFKITELQEILKELHSSQRSTEANSPIKSETASPNKTSVESLLKQLWSDSEEEEDDGQGQRKSGEDSGMEQELFCSQSSYSENQKSPVMSGQMSDGIKNSHLNQNSRYENKTNIENLDTESALNSPLKYVQENCDYSHSKSGTKTVKNTSLIFENDELEVYSNVSSSFEKSPEKNHPIKNLELESGNSKNIRLEKRSISPPVIADIDHAYSPEIPIIQSSQIITEKSDQEKSLSAVPDNCLVTKHIQKNDKDCANSEDLLDDLPLLKSPRKSRLLRQTRENTFKNIDLNFQGKDSRQEWKHQSQTIATEEENENEILMNKKPRKNCKKNDDGNNGMETLKKNNNAVTGKEIDLKYGNKILLPDKSTNVNKTMHDSFDNSNDSLIVVDPEDNNHSNNDLKVDLTNEDIRDVTHDQRYKDNDTGLNSSLNMSGGDLFASPSPTIQRTKTCHSRLTLSQDVIDVRGETSSAITNSNLETLKSPAFRKCKRKTSEMETPTKKSPLTKKIRTNMEANDISIIGDNFDQLSSQESESPKFKAREKKWKFSSRSNFMKSQDITFSGPVKLNEISEHYEELSDNHDLNSSSSKQHSKTVEVTNATDNLNDSGFEMNLTQSNFQGDIDEKHKSSDENEDEVSLITGGESDIERKDTNVTLEYDMNVAIETDDVSCDDVWEDFDDCGGDDFDGIIACKTPCRPVTDQEILTSEDAKGNESSAKSDRNKHQENHDQNKHFEEPADQIEESENLTFCDESFAIDEKPSTSTDQYSFKTPVMSKERQKTKQTWKEPSPFTPMPNYDSMATPQIKRKVQNYGVKPVGKKRMIKLLKDIYNKTHQYETDSEFEDEVDEKCNENTDVRKDDTDNNVDDNDDDEEDELEDSLNDSQESQNSDLVEESVMVCTEEETQPLKPGEKSLNEKLMEFIRKQPDIQVRILMYEPLELDILKQKITEAEIKCSMEKLKEFLDDKCITFTMKNMRKSPRKKKRSPKKRKATENSPTKSSPVKGQGRGRKKLNPS
ncbi:uncharacterized protein LOC127736710 [Mytilus californianus]|uniref:uncharacterized protein LOC127736710 n=1 Tax=Mytilus californianus TaxID=6549 RepID=UPI0022485039|nr:uncharacterized protein LOC127736710 [Mytilus californianus]